MTVSTTVISADTYKEQLAALVTKIQLDISALTAFQVSVAPLTNLHAVGIVGWLKQVNAVLRMIAKIERMLALITQIIAEIAALPAEAVALAVADAITASNQAVARVRTYIAAQINKTLDQIVSPDDISQLQELQEQLEEAQQELNTTQTLLAQVSGGAINV